MYRAIFKLTTSHKYSQIQQAHACFHIKILSTAKAVNHKQNEYGSVAHLGPYGSGRARKREAERDDRLLPQQEAKVRRSRDYVVV